MAIFLEAPTYQAGGPDGNGWNRLSLNAHMGALTSRCAMRPRTYAALWEAQDTRRATWGGRWGACDYTTPGDCTTCPRLTRTPRPLLVPDDRVMVRIYEHQPDPTRPGGTPAELRIIVRPDGDWHSASVWTWEEIYRAPGWTLGRQFVDEQGGGFWLHKAKARTA